MMVLTLIPEKVQLFTPAWPVFTSMVYSGCWLPIPRVAIGGGYASVQNYWRRMSALLSVVPMKFTNGSVPLFPVRLQRCCRSFFHPFPGAAVIITRPVVSGAFTYTIRPLAGGNGIALRFGHPGYQHFLCRCFYIQDGRAAGRAAISVNSDGLRKEDVVNVQSSRTGRNLFMCGWF